jgi:hypothetical protein
VQLINTAPGTPGQPRQTMNKFELSSIEEAAAMINRLRAFILANGMTMENAALTGEAEARANTLTIIAKVHRETA